MAPRLETSIVKRASAITLHKEGYNTREISEKTCVHQRTVSRIIAHYKETGDIEFKKRSGRPRKTELSDDVYLHTLSKRKRRLTAAQLQAAMNETLIWPICKTTIKNRLKEVGLRGCIAIRKPLLRAANKKKRLAWARLYKNWTYRDWVKVLWTDESKFVVFGSNRKVYVRRKPGEQLLEDCVVSTVKHGGSSVMVWGCFGGEKVGDIVKVDGRMDRFHYKAILEEHAIPSGLAISSGFWAAGSFSNRIMTQSTRLNCGKNFWRYIIVDVNCTSYLGRSNRRTLTRSSCFGITSTGRFEKRVPRLREIYGRNYKRLGLK